jgi:type I restriction enzyme R subunit
VNALPDDTIAIREKLREVKTAQQQDYIKRFDAAVIGHLRQTIAPLMQWRVLEGPEDAYRFDLLVARAQTAKLKQSAEYDDYKDQIINQVTELPVNLSQVKAKIEWIDKAKNSAWWGGASVLDIETMRRELRGIMHCRNKPKIVKAPALQLDITDSEEESEKQVVRLEGLDLVEYRHRVQSVFRDLFDEAPALQKIKAGLPVQQEDLKDLIQKVMLRDPDLKVDDLLVHFPNKGQRLDIAIRQVIGLNAQVVNEHFTRFAQKYANLTSHQLRFLELLKRHIATYGTLELERLYEQPFTQIHSEGVDGVFQEEEQIGDLIHLIDEINRLAPAAAEAQE